MDYKMFKDINNRNKMLCRVGRIKDVNLGNNTCTLIVNNKCKVVKISDLVQSIIKGNGCISNPSALANYTFSRKRKDLIKDKKKAQIELEEKFNGIRKAVLQKEGLLYHGSDGGIIGSIDCKRNKGVCDFGAGFYTGDSLLQAENRISNTAAGNGIVYAYTYNLSNIDVYNFTDDVLWSLYVGYNRGILSKVSLTDGIKSKLDKINRHDVVIGLIADDKISMVYNDFLSGDITDICLSECLKLVNYGKQYVFKTDTFVNKLKLYKEYVLTNKMKADSIQWGRNLRKDIESNIIDIKRKYRRDGRFIDEVLKDYEE